MTNARVESPDTTNVGQDDSDAHYNPESSADRVGSCPDEKSLEDDATLRETIDALKMALAQKQQEFLALSDVVAAETSLVKKSLVVTALSTLAAFVFACFGWLVLNWAMAISLMDADFHYGFITLIVFVVNIALSICAFKVAKDAYRHLTLMPVFRTLCGQIGFRKTEEK